MFDEWMESAGGIEQRVDQRGPHRLPRGGSRPSLLPLFLWLEADRLATLGREIDQPSSTCSATSSATSGDRPVENRPYGKVELRMPELMYPEAHPYHHPVIGSHADLEAASVKDVQASSTQHLRAGQCLAGGRRRRAGGAT